MYQLEGTGAEKQHGELLVSFFCSPIHLGMAMERPATRNDQAERKKQRKKDRKKKKKGRKKERQICSFSPKDWESRNPTEA